MSLSQEVMEKMRKIMQSDDASVVSFLDITVRDTKKKLLDLRDDDAISVLSLFDAVRIEDAINSLVLS